MSQAFFLLIPDHYLTNDHYLVVCVFLHFVEYSIFGDILVISRNTLQSVLTQHSPYRTRTSTFEYVYFIWQIDQLNYQYKIYPENLLIGILPFQLMH